MADCSNVEIRELLPERAGAALSAADVARVDAHVASCPLCTAELALITAARRSLRVAPAIDVARISAGVVAATVAPSRPKLVSAGREVAGARPAPRLRWIGWKAAAAVTIAAAGIGSFAVWQS
ncbi:MAG TPA: zf-HC2 domain-containing protein, partial [Gemmatimonadaceae bacterium]|nr:zf-HC2 domain-containing protein [Gemmatimonadaceae bacterium]